SSELRGSLSHRPCPNRTVRPEFLPLPARSLFHTVRKSSPPSPPLFQLSNVSVTVIITVPSPYVHSFHHSPSSQHSKSTHFINQLPLDSPPPCPPLPPPLFGSSNNVGLIISSSIFLNHST